MPSKLIFSEEKTNEIINLYNDNVSLINIGKKFHHSRETIKKLLESNNIIIRTTKETSRKYIHDFNYFENIDSEHKAYWLGFIYADGFIESKRQYGSQKFGITLSIKDKDHLYKFKEDIQATNPILDYVGSGYNKNGYFSKILLSSQKTVDDLKKHGVLENKTFILKFPNIPNHLYKHFIRGYLDGDGYISVNDNICYFGFTGSYDMLMEIKKFFNSSGNIQKDKTVYSFKMGGTKKTIYELSKIYNDSSIYLDRKYEKYKIALEKFGESQGIKG